jgi:hypothetical protein
VGMYVDNNISVVSIVGISLFVVEKNIGGKS